MADPQDLPRDRAYGQVSAQLGRQRVRELLIGALEIDELAVRPHARGNGTGRALLAEITADAPDDRAWLLTARVATDTVATYRRLGWHEVTPARHTERRRRLPRPEPPLGLSIGPAPPGIPRA